MNRKAQIAGMIVSTLIVIMYLFLWAYLLGPQLSIWGAEYVTSNNPVGLELLFYNYINLFLGLLPLLLYILVAGYTYIGGG